MPRQWLPSPMVLLVHKVKHKGLKDQVSKFCFTFVERRKGPSHGLGIYNKLILV